MVVSDVFFNFCPHFWSSACGHRPRLFQRLVGPLHCKNLHQVSGLSMVGKLVPLKGGIGGIVHPSIGRKYTTYIPLIVLAEPGGLYICYRSHRT